MTTGFKNLNLKGDFGLVSSGRKRQAFAGAPKKPLKSIDWLSAMIPMYAQNLSSCVGHAIANCREAQLRITRGINVLIEGQQIDGDAIWRHAVQKHYPKGYEGGIQQLQGIEAAIELGVYPKDTQVVELAPSIESIVAALDRGPIIQGLMVTTAWQEPSPSNGMISPNARAMGGHETIIAGYWYEEGRHIIVGGNSWGSEWGWYGLFQIDWDEWLREWQAVQDGPFQLVIPDGSINDNGWQKNLIEVD